MDKDQENQKKKKSGALDKILLGVVIGGAVGSVVGATVSNKEIREKVREKISDTSDTIKDIVQKKEKKTLWHRLNKIFCRKEK